MVVVTSGNRPLKRSKKTKAVGVPTIDMYSTTNNNNRDALSHHIVDACEEFGIFKIVNHGVSLNTISNLETHGINFFSQPPSVKQHATASATASASATTPFGYGCRNIGPNGDMGDLEYLLLHANISSTHPPSFRCTVNEYVEAVGELACDVLDLMAEGLWVPEKKVFSRLIRDAQSDSLLRLNHYPPIPNTNRKHRSTSGDQNQRQHQHQRIGFGEHSDPQILTILRSNDVSGLQICMPDGLWVPVPPDPTAFYVMVGDALQVLTNGRFVSVKHRALANKSASKGRMSVMYFAAPPLNALISPIKEMVSPLHPSLYNPFTWGEYKRAMRSSRLSDCRLNLFKTHHD